MQAPSERPFAAGRLCRATAPSTPILFKVSVGIRRGTAFIEKAVLAVTNLLGEFRLLKPTVQEVEHYIHAAHVGAPEHRVSQLDPILLLYSCRLKPKQKQVCVQQGPRASLFSLAFHAVVTGPCNIVKVCCRLSLLHSSYQSDAKVKQPHFHRQLIIILTVREGQGS